MTDDATIVLKDITAALATTDREAEDKPAALLVVGGELNGTLFDLVENTTTVGRLPTNTIALEFAGISRLHFTLLQVDESDGFDIKDGGSKNGTFLNNRKLTEPVNLQKGDIIKIGSMALKFLPKGDPERLTYEKLNLEANTDLHTGCYNKAYFNKSIDMEVKKSKVTGLALSLIIFDLDHFKHLNDNYGHDAGDYVLKAMAKIVQTNGVRDQDIFSRYGGEEFVILLPSTNLKQAFEIAERLRKLIEEFHFMYDKKRLPVTASVGIADYRQGVLTGTDLFKRADTAIYQAKNGGRNQVRFYRD